MNIYRKITMVFTFFCMSALLMTGFFGTPVMANTEGVAYIAKATPYYKHPVTGKVEDAGNNEALGQSMTESVLHKKALLEKTKDGKVFATVRIYLTDNLTDVKIWTQKNSGDSWTKTGTTIMQENIGGEYCTDYRFEIPDETAIMKMSFYVTPMGRDVIFYFQFSDLKTGTSDFIVSVQEGTGENGAEQALNTADTQNQPDLETVKNSEMKKSESVTTKESGDRQDGASGEEVIENAQGLVVSEDSNIEKSNFETERVTQQDKTQGSSGIYVSWILVLQCIIIITVPSLIILLALALYFKFISSENYDEEETK